MDEITSPQNLIQWLPTALRKPKHLSLISAGLLLISFVVVFISLVPTFYYFTRFLLTFLREELAGPTLPMGRIFWTYFIFSTLLLNYGSNLCSFGLSRVCYDGTMYKSWCDNYTPSFTSKVIAGGSSECT